MPFLAPSFARLPPLDYLLADQMESRKHIARHLGVSLSTLQRYQASGNAPRAVYLAGICTSAVICRQCCKLLLQKDNWMRLS